MNEYTKNKNKIKARVKKKVHQTFFGLSRFNLLRYFILLNVTCFPSTSHLPHLRYNYQLTFITAVKIATKTQRHKVTPRILIKKIPWCLGALVAKN
jgi:hypothetical protein